MEISFRDLSHGDMGWIIGIHGEAYNNEFGWYSLNLEILTAEIVLDFAKNHDPNFEKVWIAYSGGKRLGCIFVVRESDDIAKIRLVFVSSDARGEGLGSKLINRALDFIKSKKEYKKVVLWTHSDLVSARKIYQANGFKLISEKKHSDFGPELTGQMWQLELKSN